MKKTVVFIGGFKYLGNEEYFKYYKNSFFSSDPLQKAIITGLEKNNVNVLVLNLPFFPKSKNSFSVKRQESIFSLSKIIDIPFNRKNFIEHFSKIKHLKEEVSKLENVDYAIVYSTYFCFYEITHILKKKNIKVINVVPDLIQFTGIYQKQTIFNKVSKKIRSIFLEKNLKNIDGFVLLTEPMNEVINKFKVPRVVVEGICEERCISEQIIKSERKIIVYSGSLQYRYGLRILLDAINLLPEELCDFYFLGSGEAANEIKIMEKKKSNIKFFGVADRDFVHKIQASSFALINPRQNNEEFTKYSFPSKNIEYLLSGRPVICYKLDGIPNEYDNFFIYPSDNSLDCLINTIKSVLMYSDEKADKIGQAGKGFVLTQKNDFIQCKKIIKLMEEI